jgi:uncharacterized protein YccT (UPF0319 family)
MTGQHAPLCAGRARTGLLVIAGLILLSGCSSSMTRVQTWDGAAADASQVAILEAPGTIRVEEVNGRAVPRFLVENLSLSYELLPGENQIVFTYRTIWARSGVVDNGESKVHVVETPRQMLTINAEPGATYQFEIDKPRTRTQAEAMASDFSVNVLDSGGQVVATSSAPVAADVGNTAARAPVPDSRTGNAPAGVSAAALEQLKALWGETSEEEKREFLRWAFE